jgi:glucosamine-6-phosphate deaminase
MTTISNDPSWCTLERIPTRVFEDSAQVSCEVARQIAELISSRSAEGKMCVLGLATGSSPTEVYTELIRLHKEEGLSFKNVITFNLDEYFPMQPNALQSYVRFMNEHLFDHIDIDPKNVHLPDGTLSIEEVPHYCKAYEKAINDAGGIDIQLLGIGRTGHVGFNEPGSGKDSLTRLIWLDQLTRQDAASDFYGVDHVPFKAITMGVGTILNAKRVVMLAFGEGKAPIIREAVEGEITEHVAASFLQEHSNAHIYLDAAAAAKLTRVDTPWKCGPVDWSAKLIRNAVIWLASKTDKAILKLTEADYNENHLQDLIAEHGPSYDINLSVFKSMQATITGWPGGRTEGSPPQAPGPRNVDHDVFPKRVLIFSPHPDDDVISMGGTLIRLADQGHEVHVAYQVSGSIAVFDEDAIRFADFASDFNHLFDIDIKQTVKIEEHLEEFLKHKQPGQVDSEIVQKIKAVIRRGEARAAVRSCGVPSECLHFMDMPFYETGTVRKKPIGEDDIQITIDLLEKIKPHQIYAAGDLSDPHGTHRVCLAAIFEAMRRIRDRDWVKQCELWLYRGAWQEWGPQQIEMAVPLSPGELDRKRHAIFKHESQKDSALFPGFDSREFWQRAEQRNRDTAKIYDKLGLAEYEAIEAFVLWDGIAQDSNVAAHSQEANALKPAGSQAKH